LEGDSFGLFQGTIPSLTWKDTAEKNLSEYEVLGSDGVEY
jgi:hypothetical protein